MAEINPDKCRMTRYPVSVLTRPAEPVERIDDNIRELVERMTDLMIKHKGIGFAAPQAGVALQIFIVSLQSDRKNRKVFINPTVKVAGDLEPAEEGCLSVPNVYTKIRRYNRCTVTAMDLEGRAFTEEAEGLYARCIQHEYDHIQGMTIVQKMSSTARIANRKQLKKLQQDEGM